MDLFGAAHGWGEQKRLPLPKIYHTYPAIMKLGTYIPQLKKIKKDMSHVTHRLFSADTSIFSPESSKFCYTRKGRYRLHIDI